MQEPAVAGVGEVHPAAAIGHQAQGLVEGGAGRQGAIVPLAGTAGAGQGAQQTLRAQSVDPVAAGVGDEEQALGAKTQIDGKG